MEYYTVIKGTNYSYTIAVDGIHVFMYIFYNS